MRRIGLAVILFIALILPASAAEPVSAFDRVMKSNTIRCGYAMWTPVLYQNLETSKLEGIAHDLMEEIGKRLSMKVEWAEETGWGTLVEGLSTHRYDMICVGIGNISSRAKVMDFTAPIFYSPLLLIGRKDDTRFDKSYETLNAPDYKISVLDGEITSIITPQIFPLAQAVSMPQMVDYAMLLKELEGSKSDATTVTPETYAEYNHNNPGKLRILNGGKPITVFPASFGLPQGEYELKRMIDITIRELIYDGTVERLLKKYEKYPGTFLRPDKAYKEQ